MSETQINIIMDSYAGSISEVMVQMICNTPRGSSYYVDTDYPFDHHSSCPLQQYITDTAYLTNFTFNKV